MAMFTPASEMKDSGIEWIGQIPENWRTIRFKFVHGSANVGMSVDRDFWSDDENDTPFYTAQINPIHMCYKEFPNWKYTSEQDLLLARNATPYVYLPVSNAAYTDHIIRVDIKSEFDRRYIRYCLQQSIGYDITEGVSLPTWSISIWNRQFIPIMSLSEQQAIADYLDDRCSKIDEIIAEATASIEEYKKLKQAVIFEAVTKGIQKNRLCDSSILDWCEEGICDEWDVSQIRYLYKLRNERNEKPLEEVNLISLYTDKGVVQHADLDKTTGNKAVTADGYKLVYPEDIIVNIILCWMGAIGRCKYYGVTSPAYDIYEPIDTNIVYSRYYHYLFRTDKLAGKCYTLGRGIMMMRWRTYSSEFRSIKVPVPPIGEQKEIADYLDERISQIDALISEKYALINDLQAYKKSLIYEVVTGKRRVV